MSLSRGLESPTDVDNTNDERQQNTSSLTDSFPEPQMYPHLPPVNDKDYPQMHEIKPTRPISYSAAGDIVKDIRVILVTVTEAEFRAVMGQARSLKGNRLSGFRMVSLEDHTSFYVVKYGMNKVAIIRTDQGARETRRVLDKVQGKLKAEYVIAVGICYGLNKKKVKLGDVIVSNTIIDLTKKRACDGSFVFHQIQNTTGTLYNVLKMGEGFAMKNGIGPNDYVHICPGDIVSESTLVNDKNYKDLILKQIPYALGGEMEGAGIIELAEARGFQWIIIKAVTDWGDGKKETCREWQPFAAVAAAKYIKFHFKKKELKDQLKDQLQQENDQLKQDKDQLKQENDQLKQDKDQLKQDKDQLKQDKDQLKQDKDQLKQENDQLKQDKDQLKQEKDQLKQEKDQFQQKYYQLQQFYGQQEKTQLRQNEENMQSLANL